MKVAETTTLRLGQADHLETKRACRCAELAIMSGENQVGIGGLAPQERRREMNRVEGSKGSRVRPGCEVQDGRVDPDTMERGDPVERAPTSLGQEFLRNHSRESKAIEGSEALDLHEVGSDPRLLVSETRQRAGLGQGVAQDDRRVDIDTHRPLSRSSSRNGMTSGTSQGNGGRSIFERGTASGS